MNLVPGRIKNGGVQTASGTLLPLARSCEENREVVYGFRPEACVLGVDGGAPARITTIEHMGAAVQVYAELAGTTVCALESARRPWRAGEQVRLRPDPARVMLFDPATGRALDH